MTDPISHLGRKAQIESANRQLAKDAVRTPERSADTPAPAPAPVSDELKLSAVALKAMQEPEFDRVKVDAIKTAIQQGQYPLDSRRIAENFVAIEKMIKG
jgi:negative regulator of flagellin synthesis FlgM